MFTKRCLGIGLVLALTLMLGAAVEALTITPYGNFIPVNSEAGDSLSLNSGYRSDLRGVATYTFVAPVQGRYTIGLYNWGKLTFEDAATSVKLSVDGSLLIEHLSDNAGIIDTTTDRILTAGAHVFKLESIPLPQWSYINNVRIDLLQQLYSPDANAGPDQTVEIGLLDIHNEVDETATLVGSGTDSDGTIVSYEWKLGANVVPITTAPATIVVSVPYDSDRIYTLTVTDNDGFKDSDSVSVTHSTENLIKDLIDALPRGLLKEDTGR